MRGVLLALLLVVFGCSSTVVKEPEAPVVEVVKQKAATIDWQPFSDDLLMTSQALGKPVFIYLSHDKSENCQRMNRNTLSNPIIIGAINKQFIPTRIDVAKQTELAQTFYREGITIPRVIIMQQDEGRLFTIEIGGYADVFKMINIINRSRGILTKAINENPREHQSIPSE